MEGKTEVPGGAAASPPSEFGGALQSVIDKIFDEIRGNIIAKDFDLGDAMVLGNHVMELLNAYPEVGGADKKKVVIHIVNRAIDEIPMDEGLRAGLKVATNSVLGKVIELIYKAWMKHFDKNSDGKVSCAELKEGCIPPCCKRAI